MRWMCGTGGLWIVPFLILSAGCDSIGGKDAPARIPRERSASIRDRPVGSALPVSAPRRAGDNLGASAALWRVAVYGLPTGSEPKLSDSETVRVVLFLDREIPYRRGEQAASRELSRRLFLDLERVEIGTGIPGAIPIAAGGLRRVRVFALDTQTTRVSFDVDDEAAYRISVLADPFRLVMDFRRSATAASSRGKQGRGPTVVLDPGHGGYNQGAVGPTGLQEATVALQLAKRVRSALGRRLPGSRVVLTRERNEEVELQARTALANGYHADLFVSIHFNASHSPEDKGGVSTFILDTSDDVQAIRLAARENDTSEQEVSDLQVILASLYRQEQVRASERLARSIHRSTLAAGRRMLPELPDRGVKRALFFVLVGARMPAVLLEASFITNRAEEEALRTDRYRDLLAEGITNGIIEYLQAQAEEKRNKPI